MRKGVSKKTTDKPYSRGQLIECETCGQSIAAFTTKCVHCGKRRGVADWFDRQQLVLLSLAIFSLALSMGFFPLVLITLYAAYKLWKTAAPKEEDIEVNSSSSTSYDGIKKGVSLNFAVVKKTFAILGVLVLGLVIVAINFSPSAEELATERGFTSVQEYRIASEEGYESKKDYDAYLAELRVVEDAAIEAEKKRLAAVAEEKRLAILAEEKRLAKKKAEPKNRAYAAKVVKHIKAGGNYGFIAIRSLDVQDFVGKSCAEALGYASVNHPSTGSMGPQIGQIFGYSVDGGWVSEISTSYTSAKPWPDYSMPTRCNLFAADSVVESSCNLDDPKYIHQVKKEHGESGLATKWANSDRLSKEYYDMYGEYLVDKNLVYGPFLNEYPAGPPLVMISDELRWSSAVTYPFYVCIE